MDGAIPEMIEHTGVVYGRSGHIVRQSVNVGALQNRGGGRGEEGSQGLEGGGRVG